MTLFCNSFFSLLLTVQVGPYMKLSSPSPPNDSRKFDLMPHFTFKFATHATIACHATFFIVKLPCCHPSSLSSFVFLKKIMGNLVNSLLKNSINCNFYFKVTFFKTNCAEVVFFKISQRIHYHWAGRCIVNSKTPQTTCCFFLPC